jgi:cytochrome oxidase Cu insertion factor (SCO1/SenC/PrrC family)
MNNTESKSRGPFWALLALTGLPFMLALYFFYNPDMIAGLTTANKGQLLTPARQVPQMTLQTLDGKGFDTSALKESWTLLLISPSACDTECEKNLFLLRQIRLAMGENRKRIHRLMLLTDTDNLDQLKQQLEPYEGTRVITGSPDDRQLLLSLLETGDLPPNGRIFTIDPQGKIILAYDLNPNWKDILKDLEHLLKVVQL